jgi:hypothetical protein
MIGVTHDPRWQRLQHHETACRTCGQTHSGVFDIAYASPYYWEGEESYVPNSAVRHSTHFLSEDFCVKNGEYRFVRGVLLLPLIGSQEHFGLGVWSSLSQASFDSMLEHFNDGDYPPDTQWFGWFSNQVRGYPDTLHLKCQVVPRGGRQRPSIELEPTDHPLAQDQRNGIDVDRLLEIYSANGHELDLSEPSISGPDSR